MRAKLDMLYCSLNNIYVERFYHSYINNKYCFDNRDHTTREPLAKINNK